MQCEYKTHEGGYGRLCEYYDKTHEGGYGTFNVNIKHMKEVKQQRHFQCEIKTHDGVKDH